jgi:hypothetical protein
MNINYILSRFVFSGIVTSQFYACSNSQNACNMYNDVANKNAQVEKNQTSTNTLKVNSPLYNSLLTTDEQLTIRNKHQAKLKNNLDEYRYHDEIYTELSKNVGDPESHKTFLNKYLFIPDHCLGIFESIIYSYVKSVDYIYMDIIDEFYKFTKIEAVVINKLFLLVNEAGIKFSIFCIKSDHEPYPLCLKLYFRNSIPTNICKFLEKYIDFINLEQVQVFIDLNNTRENFIIDDFPKLYNKIYWLHLVQ